MSSIDLYLPLLFFFSLTIFKGGIFYSWLVWCEPNPFSENLGMSDCSVVSSTAASCACAY